MYSNDFERDVHTELCADFPVFNCTVQNHGRYLIRENSECLAPWINKIKGIWVGIGVSDQRGERRDYFKDIVRLDSVYSLFTQKMSMLIVSPGDGSIIRYLNSKLYGNYKGAALIEHGLNCNFNSRFLSATMGDNANGDIREESEYVSRFVLSRFNRVDFFFSGEMSSYHEVHACLRSLRDGGNCVFLVENCEDRVSQECMYLLCQWFRKCTLFTPAFSNRKYFLGIDCLPGREWIEEKVSWETTGKRMSNEFQVWVDYVIEKSRDVTKQMSKLEYNQTLLDNSFQIIM